MGTLATIKTGALLLVLFLTAPLLGRYFAKVYRGGHHVLSFLAPLERGFYRISGIDAGLDMGWKEYLVSLLAFNGLGLAFLFLVLMTQAWLPLNPQHLPNLSWHLAFNTAVSFVTNTNWQSYSGESTLSYLSQVAGLTTQNFASAATGMAVALVIARAFASRGERKTLLSTIDAIGARGASGEVDKLERSRKPAAFEPNKLGNFWVDLTRTMVYILLPLSLAFAIFLMSQGVPQTFAAYAEATTLEGKAQAIPLGPAASPIAIEQLGTNGGGFFGANSAHPFENPTPLSSFFETLAILLIPAAFPFLFGEIVGKRKQGWALFGAMAFILALCLVWTVGAESAPMTALGGLPALEGKETRLGPTDTAIWSVFTTAASNGSVNGMHASGSPVMVLVTTFLMALGEVVFGGVGSGLYGMILFALLAVFIAGLMVGRSPEFLGRKIESREVQLSMLGVIAPSFVILVFAAIALALPVGRSSILNSGPRGFAEVLYAFSSAAGNNGSALAGLNANTPFYNMMMGIGMLIGRYLVIVPVLAIAGSLCRKQPSPESAGTFRTDTLSFAILLVFVVLIIGGLTFFPALALGPIAEGFLASAGRLF
jgi:K+-transporting ATPase ATPase A chain